MSFQQEHLPQDRPATEDQEYGFAIEDFIADQWPYLLAVLFIIGIFIYARYQWRKRNNRNNGSR